MSPSIFIVVNSPLFVFQHLKNFILSCQYPVTILLPNTYSQLRLPSRARYIYIPMFRNPSPLDFLSILIVIYLRLLYRPSIFLSFTPKGALIGACTAFFPGISIHYFTGQRWATFHGFKRFLFKLPDLFALHMCKVTLCDSFSQSSFIYRNFSVKSHVLGHGSLSGVDPQVFMPLDPSESLLKLLNLGSISIADYNFIKKSFDSCIIFGFVGRIHRDKGIFDLLRAFSHLDSNLYRLVLCGPVDLSPEDFASFLNLIDYYNIKWLNFVTHPQFVYPCFNCIVLPSYREGFGGVILEAAYCSVPSIVSDIPGPTDFVVNGETGFIVKPGDPDSLFRVMSSVKLNDLVQLGQTARDRAVSAYGSEFVVSNLIEFLRSYLPRF